MPRLQSDLVELLIATAAGKLDTATVQQDPRTACTIMAVSGGYPGSYEKGFPVSGLDAAFAADSLVFHAGTTLKDGAVVTSGGRVLCVTSFGNTVTDAVAKSRKVLQDIDF